MVWGRALSSPCPFWIIFCLLNFLSKISKLFWRWKLTWTGLIWNPQPCQAHWALSKEPYVVALRMIIFLAFICRVKFAKIYFQILSCPIQPMKPHSWLSNAVAAFWSFRFVQLSLQHHRTNEDWHWFLVSSKTEKHIWAGKIFYVCFGVFLGDFRKEELKIFLG